MKSWSRFTSCSSIARMFGWHRTWFTIGRCSWRRYLWTYLFRTRSMRCTGCRDILMSWIQRWIRDFSATRNRYWMSESFLESWSCIVRILLWTRTKASRDTFAWFSFVMDGRIGSCIFMIVIFSKKWMCLFNSCIIMSQCRWKCCLLFYIEEKYWDADMNKLYFLQTFINRSTFIVLRTMIWTGQLATWTKHSKSTIRWKHEATSDRTRLWQHRAVKVERI